MDLGAELPQSSEVTGQSCCLARQINPFWKLVVGREVRARAGRVLLASSDKEEAPYPESSRRKEAGPHHPQEAPAGRPQHPCDAYGQTGARRNPCKQFARTQAGTLLEESPDLRVTDVSGVTSLASEKGRSSSLLTDKPLQTIIFGSHRVPLQQDKQIAFLGS